MRKITIASVRNFLNFNEFKQGNTKVTVNHRTSKMYLHGNLIAVNNNGKISITNAGYQTMTTKERLNGLPNVNIYQKNFEWYLNGKKWDGEMTEVN